MFPTKTIFRFLGILLLAYIGCFALLSVGPVKNGLFNAFRASSIVVSQTILPKSILRSEMNPENLNQMRVMIFSEDAVYQAKLEASRKGQGQINLNPQLSILLDLSVFLLLPIAFLFALILATPNLSIQNKLIALPIGLAIYWFLGIGRIFIWIYGRISAQRIGIYELSEFWTGFYYNLSDLIRLGVLVVWVVIIWVLVAFRKSNWKAILTAE